MAPGGSGRGGRKRGSSGRSADPAGAKRLRGGARKPSSRRWLERQLADPYVKQAKAQGYASRAAFKLIEIDDRYRILKPGSRVVDLGAAPGGWTQVAVARTGSPQGKSAKPLVVGIDVLEMEPVPGALVLQMDFLATEAPAALLGALGGVPPDIVVSDLAAPTTGHRRTDQLRTMALAEAAAEFAMAHLARGGAFLCKTFQGGTEMVLLAELKRAFASVHHVKPPASRSESAELYFLARGFRGSD